MYDWFHYTWLILLFAMREFKKNYTVPVKRRRFTARRKSLWCTFADCFIISIFVYGARIVALTHLRGGTTRRTRADSHIARLSNGMIHRVRLRALKVRRGKLGLEWSWKSIRWNIWIPTVLRWEQSSRRRPSESIGEHLHPLASAQDQSLKFAANRTLLLRIIYRLYMLKSVIPRLRNAIAPFSSLK